MEERLLSITKPQLTFIKIEDIDLGDRYRKDLGDLKVLSDSIQRQGLIHPPAVMDKGDGKYLLLAGCRRVIACKNLNMAEIPVRVYPDKLTTLEIRSIELSENLKRKDLSYAEEVLLISEIDQLQKQIYGEKISRTVKGAPGWTQKDTADLLGKSPATISLDIELAKAITMFPELGQLATKQDAKKLLKETIRRLEAQQLALKIEQESVGESQIKAKKHQLINSYCLEDFFEGVKGVPTNSVRLVEVDPPYAIEAESTLKGGTMSYNDIPAQQYPAFLKKVMEECYKVMYAHSWILFWHSGRWAHLVYKLLQETGFTVCAVPGLWIKRGGQTQAVRYNLANCYEPFYYARKGTPELSKQGRANLFEFDRVPPAQKFHETTRPIELMQEILSCFAYPGWTNVMIPFLGSGNTLLAAHNLGMVAWGYEKEPSYKNDFIVKVEKGTIFKYRSYQ